jgi:chromosome segregation protein
LKQKMYLKRLEIHGFKSFAQKTTMEFAWGVIAVVGPNGSGKSNVADALRWVLGEQSAKLIRGKKNDDVIFAGSDKKVRQGFAEVFATFDNSDRRIPLDASEISIGRRIDRSGESEYLLNGNKVRLLDIVDLVLKSNIGTSRYTVIGQGTIDQMILQGAAGVKDLVDEASGVKSYYMKREKTLRRLEQTANNLMRAEDLIAEIEPRLKSLRRQAKKMEARVEIEQELKLYQREFFGQTYGLLKLSIDGYASKLNVLGSSRQDLEVKLHYQRELVDNLESDRQNEKFTQLQDQLQRLQSRKNKFLEDLSLVRGKMQSQRTGNFGDAKTLQVEVHNKAGKIAEVRQKIEQGRQQKQKIEQDFLLQFNALETVNKKLNEIYQQLSGPVSVNWRQIEKELKSLENVWQNFYSGLQASSSLDEVKRSAESYGQNFKHFYVVAQELLLGPQSNAALLKDQLEQMLKQKEDLNKIVNEAQLNLSKSKFTMDFLEKELVQLEQDKLHFDLELKKAQSNSGDDFWQEMVKEEDRIKVEVKLAAAAVTEAESSLKKHYSEEELRQKDLREAENVFRGLHDQISKIKDQESQLNVEKAKYDTQMEVLADEVKRILGEEAWQNMASAQPAGVGVGGPKISSEELQQRILRLKNQLDTIGGMDELTLKEYQETEARYNNLSTQVGDLKKGMDDLRNIIEELDEHIKTKFNEAFHRINEKFEFYFRVLFNGGRAYLSVVKAEEQKAGDLRSDEFDSSDAPEEQDAMRPEEKIVHKYEKGSSSIIGIDIKATPPGKKLATIQALSGGERALTSIALLCSLLTCFPSPFVVLDEVDAALDDANTIRFGQILGTLAHQTQFVTITHNRETMSQANMIYGVTMGDDGVSKLLSVKFDQAAQYAK